MLSERRAQTSPNDSEIWISLGLQRIN